MERWNEISKDPNDTKVTRLRSDTLRRARATKLIYDRIGYLSTLVNGQSLLDVGVVAHTQDALDSPDWLHGHLRRHAASCLGVDILEAEVEVLRKRNIDVIVADITAAPLPHTFEVITAGEVLEHIDAPGSFFKHCAAMLAPGGKLIVTTPNPWYLNVILKNLFERSVFVDSADHVGWHEASTLFELGDRHGLTLERYTGVGLANPKTFLARMLRGIQPVCLWLGFSPALFAKSIIYEFLRRPVLDLPSDQAR